ncbi:MAG: hypothetical protein ACREIC_06190, partial [Limisphaerales bacterium]
MDDAFELADPDGAQAFLKQFAPEVRRRGEACFRTGHVLSITAEEPGWLYRAHIRNGQDLEVRLSYDEEEGWGGGCTCGWEFQCEHLFAAMSALLAEYRTATVRSLSSGTGVAIERLAEARSRQRALKQPDLGMLAAQLETAKGRRLSKEELDYVRSIHAVYLRCCQTRAITPWDFHQMGLPLQDYSWGNLQIWPSFPPDEHDFWLYVAHAAEERNLPIPGFMRAITDFASIRERLARWKRSIQVEEWKRKLRLFPPENRPTTPAPQGETDLRLVVDHQEARLEWR